MQRAAEMKLMQEQHSERSERLKLEAQHKLKFYQQDKIQQQKYETILKVKKQQKAKKVSKMAEKILENLHNNVEQNEPTSNIEEIPMEKNNEEEEEKERARLNADLATMEVGFM